MQPDSIIPNPANPQSLNRFGYVLNNPVQYVDPSGNIPIDCYDGKYCGAPKLPAQKPKFKKLPVEDPDWIQWFGATEAAYEDHLNYLKDPATSFNYDGYCQGYHCGIDFGGAWGNPVYAGLYGTVIDQNLGKGGYYIIIGVGDYQVLYQALDGNFQVPIGANVTPNTIIAGIGNHSANPDGGNTHLHLEVRYSSTGRNDFKDRMANPLLFMNLSQYEQLKSKVPVSPLKNITFHGSVTDPLLQMSPIRRGGPVLWE